MLKIGTLEKMPDTCYITGQPLNNFKTTFHLGNGWYICTNQRDVSPEQIKEVKKLIPKPKSNKSKNIVDKESENDN